MAVLYSNEGTKGICLNAAYPMDPPFYWVYCTTFESGGWLATNNTCYSCYTALLMFMWHRLWNFVLTLQSLCAAAEPHLRNLVMWEKS